MKRILLAFAIFHSVSAAADATVDQFYVTRKNTISKWDGQVYREIVSSEQRVEITIENKFMYIYDVYGNHSTYKFSGFQPIKPNVLTSRAMDNSGTYCDLLITYLDNGVCLSIIYDEQIIIKYFCEKFIH